MRNWQLLTALAILCGGLVLGFAALGVSEPAHADADTEIEWLTDLDAARDLARKENKPLLIVFR